MGGGGGEIMATVICWRSGVAPELAVNLGILAEVWMIDTLIRRPTTSGASDGPPASTRSALPIHYTYWCTRILIDSTFYRSKQRVWSTHIVEVVSALAWLRLYWFRTNCNANRTVFRTYKLLSLSRSSRNFINSDIHSFELLYHGDATYCCDLTV